MKKLLVILVMITILALIITITLALNKRIQITKDKRTLVNVSSFERKPVNNNEQLFIQYHNNVNDDAKGINLDDTYDENSLSFERKEYNDDYIVGTYLQISGLKDKNVQNSINKKLFDSFVKNGELRNKQIKDEIKQNEWSRVKYYQEEYFDNQDRLYSNQHVISNFSNVLCISNEYAIKSYNDWHFYGGDNVSETFNQRYNTYCNFELINGKELDISDIFTKDADIISLVKGLYSSNSYEPELVIYEESLKPYVGGYINEYTKVGEKIYYDGLSEEKLKQYIDFFKYNKEIPFGFTPSSVVMQVKGDWNELYYFHCLNDIAIYNRYKTSNSIYENDDIGFKNIEVLNNITVGNMLKYCKKTKEDNTYYHYYILSGVKDEKTERIVSDINRRVKDIIAKVREELGNEKELLFYGVFDIRKFKVSDEMEEQFFDKEKVFYKVSIKPIIYEINENLDYKDLINNFRHGDFGMVDFAGGFSNYYNDFIKIGNESLQVLTLELYLKDSERINNNSFSSYIYYLENDVMEIEADNYGEILDTTKRDYILEKLFKQCLKNGIKETDVFNYYLQKAEKENKIYIEKPAIANVPYAESMEYGDADSSKDGIYLNIVDYNNNTKGIKMLEFTLCDYIPNTLFYKQGRIIISKNHVFKIFLRTWFF